MPCWIIPHWQAYESLPVRTGDLDQVIVDETSQSNPMALPTLMRGHVGQGEARQPPVTVVMNITTPDTNSFRQSQGQIAADAARAIERARRNL